ncbi:peptidoglycan DD-metalloendopeptidase family protein [Aliikangiella sp. IMCC44359]|uniref:peptidoglycan DD-metalloendopeptidase family protein n=1 Tax=Aliikangiella sp. IMCC44359 TaxID=3459125 RepID=UPI00403AE2E1
MNKYNIKKPSIKKLILIGSLLTVSFCTQANDNSLTSLNENQLKKSNIIYQYDEVFGFDIQKYLTQNAPHLAPYAESISHMSGESTISPKILIALMEHQTGLISSVEVNDNELSTPFGVLSQKYGFIEQLRDVAERLSKAFYKGHSFEETGKNQKFTTDADAQRAIQMIFSYGFESNELQPGSKEQLNSFGKVFYKMFPQAINTPKEKNASAITMTAPSTSLLQLPYPRSSTWYIGGSHTSTGSGNWPQSSLDMSSGSGGWGSNTSNKWVSASAAGTVKVHSSCSMEIFHSGGWSTTYYHLSNIRYSNGAYVSKNAAIANYANNKNQALCNGGQSTGPHLHWSLKLNGQYYHLNGVTVSGYKIKTGRYSYDTNCNYFQLSKNGNYWCAGNYYNSGSRRYSTELKASGSSMTNHRDNEINSELFSSKINL